jgi:hypothetical protein
LSFHPESVAEVEVPSHTLRQGAGRSEVEVGGPILPPQCVIQGLAVELWLETPIQQFLAPMGRLEVCLNDHAPNRDNDARDAIVVCLSTKLEQGFL